MEFRYQISVEEGILNQQSLPERSKVIESQIASIGDQTEWISLATRIKAKLAQEERVMMTVKQAAVQHEIERISYQALHGMLKRAQEKVEGNK